MRILDIAIKDLSQIFRDKRALIFLIAMPIVMTLFMGFAYKGGGDNAPADNRILLGWVNHDPDGLLSQQLYTLLSTSDTIKLVELAPEAVDNSMLKGEVAGVLIIPTGYSAQVTKGAISGQPDANPPQVTLFSDLSTPQGQSIYQSLRTPVAQTMSSVEIASLSAEAVGKPNDTAEFEQTFVSAVQAWSEADSNSLIKVEMAVAEPEQAWYGDNPYNQASPGILVMFAIFGLVTSGQILVQERKSHTLQRMISTSMRSWQIVTGHLLAMFGVVFIQEVLLVIFGQLALGVNYARTPFGILLVAIAIGLWIAAMGLLIGVLAKEDSQVILFSLLAMFLFSALGGLWFPLEATSGTFAVIGKAMPSAWAMNGLQNILIRGQDSSSVWLPTTILAAYAVGFFLLAVWCFRRMEI